MSVLRSANERPILADEGDLPIEGQLATDEIIEAVEALQSTMVGLLSRMSLVLAKGNNQQLITDMQDQLAILSKSVTDLVNRKPKPKHWRFIHKKDAFGEIVSTDAVQIE